MGGGSLGRKGSFLILRFLSSENEELEGILGNLLEITSERVMTMATGHTEFRRKIQKLKQGYR